MIMARGDDPWVVGDEELREAAWHAAGSRCECTRAHRRSPDAPHHGGRCLVEFPLRSRIYRIEVLELELGPSPGNMILLCPACEQLRRFEADTTH